MSDNEEDLACFTEEEEIPSKFQLRGDALRKCIQDLEKKPQDKRIHPYQIKAVLATRNMFLKDTTTNKWSSSPALIVAPTGSGKSGMIVLLPYVLQSKKVLVLTPSGVISEQLAAAFGHYRPDRKHFFEVSKICTTEKKLRGFLENVSLIESAKTISRKGQLNNVVIVNAQKFGGRSKASLVYRGQEVVHDASEFFAQFDTLIVDEAHHYPAATWLAIVTAFKADTSIERRIIFLTATPYRGKKMIPVVPSQRIAYVVNQEEIEGKTIRRSEFREEKERGYLYSHIKKILLLHKRAEPRIKHKAMILVRTTTEAGDYAKFLNESEKNFAVAIFYKQSKDKDVADFNNGKYKVAITCGLLLEGYDNCDVSVCVILRNVTSQILFDQFIGRCLRLKRFDEKKSSDSQPDQTRATVLSYEEFNQHPMWNQRNKLAKKDPEDDQDDDSYYSRCPPSTPIPLPFHGKDGHNSLPGEKVRATPIFTPFQGKNEYHCHLPPGEKKVEMSMGKDLDCPNQVAVLAKKDPEEYIVSRLGIGSCPKLLFKSISTGSTYFRHEDSTAHKVRNPRSTWTGFDWTDL